MSDTTSLPLAPTAGLFARIMAVIDRALMASARASVQKDDLPYFGL